MRVINSLLFSMFMLFSAWVFAGPVNVNTADAKEIAEAMSGVGMKKAQAIVDYRNRNGAYKSLDELAKVKGIGSKTVAKNRTNLVLDSEIPAK